MVLSTATLTATIAPTATFSPAAVALPDVSTLPECSALMLTSPVRLSVPEPDPRRALVSLVTMAIATAGLTAIPPLVPASTFVFTVRSDVASMVSLPPPERVTESSTSARTELLVRMLNPKAAPTPTLPPLAFAVALRSSTSLLEANNSISPAPAFIVAPLRMTASLLLLTRFRANAPAIPTFLAPAPAVASTLKLLTPSPPTLASLILASRVTPWAITCAPVPIVA